MVNRCDRAASLFHACGMNFGFSCRLGHLGKAGRASSIKSKCCPAFFPFSSPSRRAKKKVAHEENSWGEAPIPCRPSWLHDHLHRRQGPIPLRVLAVAVFQDGSGSRPFFFSGGSSSTLSRATIEIIHRKHSIRLATSALSHLAKVTILGSVINSRPLRLPTTL